MDYEWNVTKLLAYGDVIFISATIIQSRYINTNSFDNNITDS